MTLMPCSSNSSKRMNSRVKLRSSSSKNIILRHPKISLIHTRFWRLTRMPRWKKQKMPTENLQSNITLKTIPHLKQLLNSLILPKPTKPSLRTKKLKLSTLLVSKVSLMTSRKKYNQSFIQKLRRSKLKSLQRQLRREKKPTIQEFSIQSQVNIKA